MGVVKSVRTKVQPQYNAAFYNDDGRLLKEQFHAGWWWEVVEGNSGPMRSGEADTAKEAVAAVIAALGELGWR